MDLLDFIFFVLCGAWLIGFVWAGAIAFKSRNANNKMTTLKTNESLFVKSGKMNARKLTVIDLRKDKR